MTNDHTDSHALPDIRPAWQSSGGVVLLAALTLEVALVGLRVPLASGFAGWYERPYAQWIYFASCGLVSVAALVAVMRALRDTLARRLRAAGSYTIMVGGVVLATLAPWTFMLGWVA